MDFLYLQYRNKKQKTMAKQIYKVEVEIKETYKRTFLVQAGSKAAATRKINENLYNSDSRFSSFVYDQTTEALDNQRIAATCKGVEENPSNYAKSCFENNPEDIIIANI